MELVITLALGIGLAAASGFRIFVPFTFLSMASMAGMVELSPAWQWIGSYPAVTAFGIATLLEILAYYVPWVDNLLDTIAAPAAVVAGSILSASVTTDMSPLLTWTLAIIVGGGAAGVIQTGTTVLRGVSSVSSLGTGNVIVATGEWVAATILALLALLLPVFAALAGLIIIFLVLRRLIRLRTRTQSSAGRA